MLSTVKELEVFLCITVVASRSKKQSEEITDQLLSFQSKQNICSLSIILDSSLNRMLLLCLLRHGYIQTLPEHLRNRMKVRICSVIQRVVSSPFQQQIRK